MQARARTLRSAFCALVCCAAARRPVPRYQSTELVLPTYGRCHRRHPPADVATAQVQCRHLVYQRAPNVCLSSSTTDQQ